MMIRRLPLFLLLGLTLSGVGAGAWCARASEPVSGPMSRPLAGLSAQQVRIEQHFSIRISPGSAAVPPPVVAEAEQEDRRMPRCVPAGLIAAVQSGEGNRLLLFLRDNHVVAAELEKSCRAHDFYSGFYLERSPDGLVCVGRDKLQSRSGANCTIHHWRPLVDAPSRRFP